MKKFDVISKFSSTFLRNGKTLFTIQTQSNYENQEEDKQKEQEERLKKLYYIAVKTRNFEITQLVQRNNFFMIFQGVLIACIIYSNNTVPFIHTAVCFVGIFISFFQMQIAAGAKFWQEYWEIQVYEAEDRLRNFYVDVKNIDDFHTLFNQDIVKVKNSIYTNFYKDKKTKNSNYWETKKIDGVETKTFNAPAIFWKKPFLCEIFTKYFPFTRSKSRILTKPSVSKIPVQTGRLLLISWLFLFISSTFIGDWVYNNTLAHRIFTGFPGKSIASIDIRNQTLPNRDDGSDDDRYKKEDLAYCIFKWCKENKE